jgi:hypothetical protein
MEILGIFRFILYLTTDLRLDGTDAEYHYIFKLISLPAECLSLHPYVCLKREVQYLQVDFSSVFI